MKHCTYNIWPKGNSKILWFSNYTHSLHELHAFEKIGIFCTFFHVLQKSGPKRSLFQRKFSKFIFFVLKYVNTVVKIDFRLVVKISKITI